MWTMVKFDQGDVETLEFTDICCSESEAPMPHETEVRGDKPEVDIEPWLEVETLMAVT